MDTTGKLKQALVVGAAALALMGQPVPALSPQAEVAGLETVLAQPESVQITYRPVSLLNHLPDPPARKGDKSWQFWGEQIKRCRFGWKAPNGHYLTGYQYFYLNFMKIPIQDKDRAIADWAEPYFRDNDEIIFSQLWRNTSRKLSSGKTTSARNHVEAKCRSIGWTQISLLGVAMWTFVFRPDRAIGLGYSDDEVIDIERLWFQESWARLPVLLRTWKGQILEPLYNNKDTFTVGYKDPKNPKITKPHNSVQFTIISDKAGVFKGQRLNLIIAIEAGKWTGDSLKNFYSENLDCLEMGDYKWGMFLIGGTSNVIVNKSSNYKEIYFRSESFNATRHFTAKTMVLLGYWNLETGVSDQARALAFIMGQRKEREGDSQAYQQYIIENPLTEAECFTPNESFAYDTALIQAQIGFVRSNGYESMWRRGRIDYEKDFTGHRKTGKLKFFEDPAGKWLVNLEGLPRPKFKNLFIAALDDTYKGAEEEKLRARDSRNCLVIYCQPSSLSVGKSDMPVAIFLHQTPDMDDIYEECLRGLRYWDVSQCLYEHNHDGWVKFLRNAGESRRIVYVGTKPGLAVKGRVKTELTYLGTRYFTDKRYQSITSIPLLEALLLWGGKSNTDIGSAFHLILHLLDSTKDSLHIITRRNESAGQNDFSPGSCVVLGPQQPPSFASASQAFYEPDSPPSHSPDDPAYYGSSGRDGKKRKLSMLGPRVPLARLTSRANPYLN